MVVSTVPPTGLPHEEAIIVAELWGQNATVDVGAASPTRTTFPQFGLARKHIFRSIKQILKQRQLPHIDILQYYISDANELLAEIMRALNDVVEGGYVQYVVVSSYHVWQLRAMRAYGVTNGLTPYMMFQELESSSFTWAEEGQKTSALEFPNEFTRPLAPLGGTIAFESLA
ncbi:Aldo/keto reductase [Ceratobasidium theobromae]|uniref:Aldo/keto reductase n=1 Tax=Ceratobasidium theobromae TaxID=1582974 RepID=A0A5N5QSJ1_9AGAM|nr:Aldo/keto reductase [Ceratobasidium theobromae]